MKLKKQIFVYLLVIGILLVLLNIAFSESNNSFSSNISLSKNSSLNQTPAASTENIKTISSGQIKEIHVKETDFVRLVPKAIDPDNDQIKFYFIPPFNDNGEWQTDINSSGIYDTEITASDGISQTVQKVKIIIENKNQAPYLTDNKLVFKELELIDLKKYIKDPENDALSYVFSSPFDRNGLWKTGYKDEGNYIANFKVNDGEFMTDFRTEITIVNTNQPPTIIKSFSDSEQVLLKENQVLEFWVEAEDSDKDELVYSWKMDDSKEIETNDYGEYFFDYLSSGDHQLNLTISDGTETREKSWKIKVENVNRKPEIKLIPLNIKEGEKISLDLPEKDLDGDKLTYSFEYPLNEKGEWQTSYKDAGEHVLGFTVSDGIDQETDYVSVTIVDVDQAPSLDLLVQIGVKEGELFSWTLPVEDPDNDSLKISFENLPEGTKFNEKTKTLTWTPSYQTIKRKDGMIRNILNSLRLDKYLISKTLIPIKITACGKDLCTSGILNLIVHNVNQAPIFINLPSQINVTETETAFIQPKVEDPDGDIVRYSFSQPLRKYSGKWKTGYDDQGNYLAYVAATDGRLTTTLPVKINVLKKNRVPSISTPVDQAVVNEGQEFSLIVSASDPDTEDKLTIKLDKLPPGASFKDGLFVWNPNYQTVQNKTLSWWNEFISGSDFLNKMFSKDKSVLWLNFVANDGTIDSGYPVKVIVKNLNQAPKIVNVSPGEETITAYLNQPVIFKLKVNDPDKEKLDYTWSFGWNSQEIKGTDIVKRTFTNIGTKTVNVVVSDGFEELEKEWKVKVVKKPVQQVKTAVKKEILTEIKKEVGPTNLETQEQSQTEEVPEIIIEDSKPIVGGLISQESNAENPISIEPIISEPGSYADSQNIDSNSQYIDSYTEPETIPETSSESSGYKAKVYVK